MQGRILLVDDEKVFTANMSRLLETRDYEVMVADSGDQAIQILKNHNFDVIVLDLKMPGMDGIATLKEIKKLGLFTQTLILTGHGSIDTAKAALQLGAYDYLTKPCEIDELEEKIQGAWKRKEESESSDTKEKIKRVTRSPGSVFQVFPNGKKKQ
ncbi:MAG: response regulator [Desulfohalobiaceae bacterium]|nr:response regulator [Desulfohalobiaceae bacterium]